MHLACIAHVRVSNAGVHARMAWANREFRAIWSAPECRHPARGGRRCAKSKSAMDGRFRRSCPCRLRRWLRPSRLDPAMIAGVMKEASRGGAGPQPRRGPKGRRRGREAIPWAIQVNVAPASSRLSRSAPKLYERSRHFGTGGIRFYRGKPIQC